MDIYGYTSYPYNQPDELAKQTFGQQTISTVVPFPNRGVPEGHVMPVPTGTPWNVQGVPWGMTSPPELVQFTAAGPPTISEREERLSTVPHCKRKSLDIEPIVPPKQRITEDKMAAHLNGLHISSEYRSHALAADDVMDINMEPSTSSMDPCTSSAQKLKGHTIVLSEELKKLQTEPLLPAALIDRLEKPHMSLVVWKPRDEILATFKDEKKDAEDAKRRNGVLVSHHGVDDVEM